MAARLACGRGRFSVASAQPPQACHRTARLQQARVPKGNFLPCLLRTDISQGSRSEKLENSGLTVFVRESLAPLKKEKQIDVCQIFHLVGSQNSYAV